MAINTELQQLPYPWTNATPTDTWLAIVVRGLIFLGKTADLSTLYELIGQHPRVVDRKTTNWQAKTRQVLERCPAFVRVGDGRWSFASLYTLEQIELYEVARRERYPERVKAEEQAVN